MFTSNWQLTLGQIELVFEMRGRVIWHHGARNEGRAMWLIDPIQVGLLLMGQVPMVMRGLWVCDPLDPTTSKQGFNFLMGYFYSRWSLSKPNLFNYQAWLSFQFKIYDELLGGFVFNMLNGPYMSPYKVCQGQQSRRTAPAHGPEKPNSITL